MFASKSKLTVDPTDSFSEPDLGGLGLVEAYTPERRENMVRLEKENEILRKRLESAESAPQEGVHVCTGVCVCSW